jgi:hypothetical protein
VVSEAELLFAVNEAFRGTGERLESWPDPNPDRTPQHKAYSRLTNPERWRIVGARVEAWLLALEGSGLATVQRGELVDWAVRPGPAVTGTDLVVPQMAKAIPLVVAHSRLGEVDDGGVVLGVGAPAVQIEQFPDCGCDACDSGSQDEVDQIDRHLIGVVSGRFRRFSRGDQILMTLGDGRWSGSGRTRPPRIEEVRANPHGWDELTGASWL